MIYELQIRSSSGIIIFCSEKLTLNILSYLKQDERGWGRAGLRVCTGIYIWVIYTGKPLFNHKIEVVYTCIFRMNLSFAD